MKTALNSMRYSQISRWGEQMDFETKLLLGFLGLLFVVFCFELSRPRNRKKTYHRKKGAGSFGPVRPPGKGTGQGSGTLHGARGESMFGRND
jgi:hypothetical protein